MNLRTPGPTPLPPEVRQALARDMVTTFWVPEGVEASALQRRVRDEFGVTLAGGQGALAGRVLRIGHLGYVEQPELAEALDALEKALTPVAVA